MQRSVQVVPSHIKVAGEGSHKHDYTVLETAGIFKVLHCY